MSDIALPDTNTYKVPDDDSLIHLITSDAYAMQQKLDGRRMIVVKQQRRGGNITAYGKEHQRFNAPQEIIDSLRQLPEEPWVLDGELCSDGYHIFDLCAAPGQRVEALNFDQRYLMLKAMVNVWDESNIHTVPTWYEPKEKLFALLELRHMKAEGVVFRPRSYSAHFHGTVYKYKFYNTVDCIVMEKKVNGSRAVAIAVLDNGDYHSLGKVKCEYEIQDQMTTNQVIEVRYRKVSKTGKLVEPVFQRLRDDKQAYKCTSEQLVTFGNTDLYQAKQDNALAKSASRLGIEWDDARKLIDNTYDDE